MVMIDVAPISLKRKLEEERGLIPLVAQVWEVELPGQKKSDRAIALLVKQMEDAHVARSLWEALSAHERLCLFYLLGSGDPDKHTGITLESLCKRTQLSSEIVKEAVESLCTRWYLVYVGTTPVQPVGKGKARRVEIPAEQGIFPYRECFTSLWETGREIFASSEDRSNASLEQLVSTFTGERLSYLAGVCRVPSYFGGYSYSTYASIPSTAPILKQLYERIYTALCHPLMPFALARQLPLPAQKVFSWLCEQGGKVKMTEVRAYMEAHALGEFHPILGSLSAHALAFDTLTSDVTRWLFIPADLFAIIKRETAQLAEDELLYAFHPLEEEVAAKHEGHPLILYDLAIAVGLSVQMNLEPTKEGRLPKRLREKIRPLLHGRIRIGDALDDIYIDQVFRAALGMNLLECAAPTAEEKQRYLRGPKLEEWSQLGLVGQTQVLLQWWKGTSSWADVRSGSTPYYSSPSIRQGLLDQLKQCVPERWYRVDVLLYAIFRHGSLGLPYVDVYSRQSGHPTAALSQREMWMQREAGAYRGPLVSFLSELGIVSMASSPLPPEEGPEFFCVTAFGAVVLGSAPAEPEASVLDGGRARLVLQPNYEMLLMEFDPKLVYQLLAMAEVVRIGTVSTFRLTKAALLKGLAAGVRLDDILMLLTTHSAQQVLPQNVVYTIKDWAKAYREIHLREVFLLEASESETVEGLRHVLGNLAVEVRYIGPGNFLVLTKAAIFGDLRKCLRQAGIVVRGEPLSMLGKRR